MRFLIMTFLAAGFLLAGCATSHKTASSSASGKEGPASELTGGEWMIQKIGGNNVIDKSEASFLFMPDGRLAGNASCNRLIGAYTVKENQITFDPTGTTMMSCPEAQMEQERKILDLLPEIESFEIDSTGALVLQTADGPAILARRK